MLPSRCSSWTGLALALAAGTLVPASARAQTPLSFFPVPPCRLWDTRTPPPPPAPGGPIAANTTRDFPVRGLCGVPISAAVAVLNLTAFAATDFGDLRAYPAGTSPPNASVLNFLGDGVAVANGAIIALGTAGPNHLTIRVDMPVGSTGH